MVPKELFIEAVRLLNDTLLEAEEDPSFEDDPLYRKINTFVNREEVVHVTSSNT